MAVLVSSNGASPQYVHLRGRNRQKNEVDAYNDAYTDIEKILGDAERFDLLDWVSFPFDVPTVRYWYAFLSRERFILDMPYNKQASEILGMTVFGNCVFCSASEIGQVNAVEAEHQKKEKEEQARLYALEREKQDLARRRKFQRDNLLWWLQGFGLGLLFALGEALVVLGCIKLLMYFGYITWNV